MSWRVLSAESVGISTIRPRATHSNRFRPEHPSSRFPNIGVARSATLSDSRFYRSMTKETVVVAALLEHFERILNTHMRGLPILNPRMAVEAVGTRSFGEHRICVLITPWFMNLVLLPGTEEWVSVEQGESFSIEFPREALDFNVSRDDAIGTFLSAVLFRTVTDFPDQETARAVALEVMENLFVSDKEPGPKVINRRSLLTGLGVN